MRGFGAADRSHRSWWMLVCAGVIVVLAVAAGLGGCGAQEESVSTTAAATMTTAAPAAFEPGRGEGAPSYADSEQGFSGDDGAAAAGDVTSGSSGALATLEGTAGQKVISDARLEIEVEAGKFQAVFDQALLLADRYGGYLVSSGSYAAQGEGPEADSGMRSGTVAIRVPAASFARALADAGRLGEVKNRQVSTQDVTEEYVDLQARIANSEAHVQALLSLLAKAKTVDEILQVQQVLTVAQQQLEELKGRLRYLDEHTSYSTLSLTIYEAGVAVTTETEEWGFTQALKDAVRNLVGAVNAIVRGLGVLVPVIVVLAIIACIVYLVWRAISRRRRLSEAPNYQRYPQGWHGHVPAAPAPSATTAAAPATTAADQATTDTTTTPPATKG